MSTMRNTGRHALVIALLLAFSGVAVGQNASDYSLFIGMPDTYLEPGNRFSLDVSISNRGPRTDARLVVGLFDGTDYFWYPAWDRGFSSEPVTVRSGANSFNIIPNVLWQEVPGPGASGLVFVAGLFSDDMNTLLAGPEEITWGWAPFDDGYSINPEAFHLKGPIPGQPNAWSLATGKKVTPAGDHFLTGHAPLNLWVPPTGEHFVVTHTGRRTVNLSVVHAPSRTVVQTLNPTESFYQGLDGTSDGRRVFAADGLDRVFVYDFNAGMLTEIDQWTVPRNPMGLTLDRNESVLYVVSQLGNRLHALDAVSGAELGNVEIGLLPHEVVVHPSADLAYCSLEGDNTVAIVDISDPTALQLVQTIPVRQNPEGLLVTPDGSKLYVTNNNEDALAVITTNVDRGPGNARLDGYIDLRPAGIASFGSSPSALTFDPTGTRLYITESQDNKITVMDISGATPRILGYIPTAWYPTAVAFSNDGQDVYIVNHKGFGLDMLDTSFPGAIQIVPAPSDQQLSSWAPQVYENNTLPGRLFDIPNPDNFNHPVPARRGVPSDVIKHVFFVIRENKTYDVLLGDLGRGNGDPSFVGYTEGENVNIQSLANTFANCDNYYCTAEVSTMGHTVTTQGTANTYSEKAWASRENSDTFFAELDFLGDLDIINAFDLEVFLNPTTMIYSENLFRHCKRYGISINVHGEIVGTGHEGLIFDTNIVHWSANDLPVINYAVTDVDKLADRIAKWEQPGFEMPQLVYMLLPNDHANGSTFGFPTPQSMVADNDEATGQFVDWLSKSKWWANSVAFIIQDDPQGGGDHVDKHRSICVVASPWVRRGYISSVHYSEANIFATIGHILGMPPLSAADEVAQPMYDIFTTAPDYTPFDHTPRVYPVEMNPPATVAAHYSKAENWHVVDESMGAQHIDEYLYTDGNPMNPDNPVKKTEEEFLRDWFKVFKMLHEKKDLVDAEWEADFDNVMEAVEEGGEEK